MGMQAKKVRFSQSARREQDVHDEDQRKSPLSIRRDPLSSWAVLLVAGCLHENLEATYQVWDFSHSVNIVSFTHDIWFPFPQTHHHHLHYNTRCLSFKIPWHAHIFSSYSPSHVVYTNVLKSVNSRTILLRLQFLILHLPAVLHQASYLTSMHLVSTSVQWIILIPFSQCCCEG